MSLSLLFLFHLLIPLQLSSHLEISVFIVTCYQKNSGRMERVNVSIDPSEASELRDNCTSLSTISKMNILSESVNSWNLTLSSFHKKYNVVVSLRDSSIIRFSHRSTSSIPDGIDIAISKLQFFSESDPSLPRTIGFHLQSKNLYDVFNESTLIFSIDDERSNEIPFETIIKPIKAKNENESTVDGEDLPDALVHSRIDNEKKEEDRGENKEGAKNWIKESYMYFVIGSAILLLLVIGLSFTVFILCYRKKQKKEEQAKRKRNNTLSLQRLPEEHVLIQETSPSASISDIKQDKDEGSKQEPSTELIAKSEASKTGEVTETEQRLSRIKTAK